MLLGTRAANPDLLLGPEDARAAPAATGVPAHRRASPEPAGGQYGYRYVYLLTGGK
jgi:hypothetical protein